MVESLCRREACGHEQEAQTEAQAEADPAVVWAAEGVRAVAVSPGRPPLPPAQRRTEHVGVRFTPDEMARLYALARLLRMDDVGKFIRAMALGDFRFTQNTK